MAMYLVELTALAEHELNAATDYIAESTPDTAERWFNRSLAELCKLETNPERCPLARENELVRFEIRQLIFGTSKNYRAVFTIQGNRVVILTIRSPGQPLADHLREPQSNG